MRMPQSQPPSPSQHIHGVLSTAQQAEASSPRFSTSPSHTIIAVFQPQQRWQWQLFIRPTTPPHREIFIISKQTPEKNNKNNENR